MFCTVCGEALPQSVVNACPSCGADLRNQNQELSSSLNDNYYKGVMNAYIESFKLRTSGAINIKEYWLASILHYVVAFVFVFSFAFISSFIYTVTTDPFLEDFFLEALLFIINAEPIIYLLMSIPILTLGIRRMHDVAKSGWFAIIPIVNFILSISPSVKTNNPYR